MLLAIMFMLFLLMLAATFAVPKVKQDIQREREIELIHRGEQYARAIKKYYKKFGRYPSRLEELENTNNLRFLRKRYKDPMNPDGKFKLLYFGDLRIAQNSSRSSSGTSTTGPQDAAPATSAFGQPAGQQQQPQQPDAGTPSGFGGGRPGSSMSGSPGGTLGGAQQSAGGQFGSQQSQAGGLNSQVFGGGPIVGVASAVEKEGIHEFNNKKRYDQWMFIYDPAQDRGGLVKGPYQPQQAGTGGSGTGVPGIAPGTMGQPPSQVITPQQQGPGTNMQQPQQ